LIIRRQILFPAVAKDGERVAGEAGDIVVRAIHDELHVGRHGEELPDDELVANEIEVVQDVGLEVRHSGRVVVVGVIADDDVGPGDMVLEVRGARMRRHREWVIGVRAAGNGHGHRPRHTSGSRLAAATRTDGQRGSALVLTAPGA